MAHRENRTVGLLKVLLAAVPLIFLTGSPGASAATQLSLYPHHPFTVRVAPSYIPLAVGVKVPNGTLQDLAVMTQQSLYVTLKPGEVYMERVKPTPRLRAPIYEGQTVGRLEAVSLTGAVLASTTVVAVNNDPSASAALQAWRGFLNGVGGIFAGIGKTLSGLFHA